MRVSVIQMNSVSDKAHNLDQARRLIAQAVKADRPDLVVLPEVFSFMGGSVADKQAAADEVPGGAAHAMLADTARTHGIFLHGGSFLERAHGADEGKLFNTTVAFDRDGQELARYRKIHLFDITAPDGKTYHESATVGRGRELVVYEAGGLKIGCTICYDLRFAELYRGLAERGAQVIMVPAAFTLQTGKDHWEVLLRARAIETQTYVCASAQYGPVPDKAGDVRTTYGHSMIVDPWGHVIASTSDGTGFATASLDPNVVERVRTAMPVHRHRVLGA